MMQKLLLIAIILGSLCGAAHAQSNVTIGLGAGYSGAGATFTLLNQQGYNGQIQPSPSYTILLNSSGAATLTTLGTGIQYGVLVCKADGTACLKGTVNVTGQAQDISTALEAYPLGTGGGGTPALPFNSVQFNNAGAFGGSANMTFASNTFGLIGTSGQSTSILQSKSFGYTPSYNGLNTLGGTDTASSCGANLLNTAGYGTGCTFYVETGNTNSWEIVFHDKEMEADYPKNFFGIRSDSGTGTTADDYTIEFTMDQGTNGGGLTFSGPAECGSGVFPWICGAVTLGAFGPASGQGTHNLAALVDYANVGVSEGTLVSPNGYVSFYNSAPVQQISIAGDRQGNPAITSLLTSLNQAHLGLVNDTTTDSGAPPYTIASGTFPTIAGCGTISATAGGATAGTFTTSTTGTCTAAIPMPTAPHGWTCVAQDITKHVVANILIQSATATNSCTVTGTTAASDVITFVAYGY